MTGFVPKVSVCSQVRNQTEWAREMIQSVVSQKFKNWEHIIVDDGSSEDLKAVIDSFNEKRIRYIRTEAIGVPMGMNRALKAARGKYVCMLSADEVFSPDRLREQVEYMDANPQVDCSWGLPGGGSSAGPMPMGLRPEWEQYALKAHNRSKEAWLRTLINLEHVPLGGCGLMMKREVMENLGYQDESLTVFSDHELYCRFFEQGYIGVIVPYRWATDKPAAKGCVREVNQHKAQAEFDYVAAKHPIVPPPATGKVTVGIPCYNHAKYLPDAVASVLAQTHPVDEILILNDCSTDDFKTVVLGEIFTDPRIKIMAFDENRGMAEAQNQMAFRAKGEFFIAFSADDVLAPTYVERALAEFAKDPWTEMVASQTDFYEEDMKTPLRKEHGMHSIPKIQQRSREEQLGVLHGGNQYFGVGMYRTKAISEVHGWEKQYKVICDYQMYLKLLQRENIRIIEEPLTHTRVTGKNMSIISDQQAKELPWLYTAARKPFYRKHMKVVIATPFYEVKAFSPYVSCLTQTIRLMTALGIDWRFMELSGDSYVHRARNTMADMFLRDPDATDLFFIDSDMSWDPEALVKMCMLPDDIIGGAYPVKNAWTAWTSIPLLHEEGDTKTLRGKPLEDGSALIEAHVLAGGFLRIKRHVLEKFREAHPDCWYLEPSSVPDEPTHKFTAFFAAESVDHRFFGEDHYFSKKIREMGIPMFIYPNVSLIHWGYKDFAGNYDKWLKKSFDVDKKTPEQVAAHVPGSAMV